MSICNNFEGALMKAIRSLEQHVDSLMSYDFTELSREEMREALTIVDDMRIWRIAQAIRLGISQEEIHEITRIDQWFIDKLAILTEMEEDLRTKELTEDLLREAKRMEFPDAVIAELAKKTEKEIKDLRKQYSICAAYKMVDTCAAEFAATTPYYYSVYGGENEAIRRFQEKESAGVGFRSDSNWSRNGLISALCTVPGRLRKKGMKPLLLITTRRR